MFLPALLWCIPGFCQQKPTAFSSTVETDRSLIDQQALSSLDTSRIYQVFYHPISSMNQPEVSLVNPEWENITRVDLPQGFQLPDNPEPKVYISIERKQSQAVIFVPRVYRRQDGQILQLKKFSLDVREKNSPLHKTQGTRVYASESILANGTFYKLSLTTQGIYKIDYDYIKNQLGINPESINPANIRLFGHGGEVLPESNVPVPPDDLVENALSVIDGGDGQMNPGDYFLFFANGPHTIINDSVNKRFTHRYNEYNESCFYFLSFDKGVGKRIQTIPSPGTPNQVVTSYHDFRFIEKDSSNPGKFGKTWWGDEFSDQPGRFLTRNYQFNFPNLDPAQPVNLRTRFGAISYSGNSLLRVNINGFNLQTHVLPAIGTTYADPVLRISDQNSLYNATTGNLSVELQFTKGSSSAAGYLDFLEINARSILRSGPFHWFADWNSVGPGNIASYRIEQASAQTQVWDITQGTEPQKMQGSLSGSLLSFSQEAGTLHRFVVFDGSTYQTPAYIGKAANQNLHQVQALDYIIIADPGLKSEMVKLADHHAAKRQLKSLIVTPQEIYNEFSSGSQDVSAIRNYLKMLYDRAPVQEIPKYVLFAGDASYDYKNRIKNNTNLVPTYQTDESNDKIFGYCTDDFFGFLDDQEDINNFAGSQINTLDIGIGRLPVSSPSAIQAIIQKILFYDSPASFGPWKNNMTFNADDEDNSIHLEDAEIMSTFIRDSLPVYNNFKIYVDGFPQQSTPAGPRTPDANKAVTAQIYNGTFLMNYNGHGGPLGWCEERIFSMDDVNLMKNLDKLPLFITATCDFAPFDDPSIVSAGEILLNKSDGGAIALMTTTRLVYQDQNRDMNLNYMISGFRRMSNGQYPTLGDAFRLSKNLRYSSYVGTFAAANFRKFALLGDPALPLAFPKYGIVTDSINGVSVQTAYDTLKALGKYTISGHLKDEQGNLLSNYDGILYPIVFDKPRKLTTLQNDADSPKRNYEVQNNMLYKGKVTVKQGKFSFTFVVPKDINYAIDKGKISYYAANSSSDAAGYDKEVYIGGSDPNANNDQSGPLIRAWLNNEKFVNGGITTPNSTLIIRLSDDYGINYTGNSIGHDIVAVLDNNAQQTYVLNSFYEADLDDYRSGVVRFPLYNLSEGKHTLRIKAWDISNNSSEISLDFVVVSNSEAKIQHVYNYPNPFTTSTRFMFEHNMPGQALQVGIQIYSLSGKVVKQIRTTVQSEGTRVDDIEWDGRDAYGDKLGKGVYIYKVSVKGANGFQDSRYQKLILLN